MFWGLGFRVAWAFIRMLQRHGPDDEGASGNTSPKINGPWGYRACLAGRACYMGNKRAKAIENRMETLGPFKRVQCLG